MGPRQEEFEAEKKVPWKGRREWKHNGEGLACKVIEDLGGVYDLGDVFLVLHVARDLKLDSMIRDIFHENGEKILIIAASRIILPGSMRLVGPWQSRTYLDQDIPSQKISEILSMAGKKA